MKNFLVTLNNYGELCQFKIRSPTRQKKALNCAVGLLAKKLGRNYTSVRANYYGQKDNFNVKQLEN